MHEDITRASLSELKSLLLPHQLETTALVVRRFVLRNIGLVSFANRRAVRDATRISNEEFLNLVNSRPKVASKLIDKGNQIRSEVVNVFLQGVSEPLRTRLLDELKHDSETEPQLELLDWHLQCVCEDLEFEFLCYSSLLQDQRFRIGLDRERLVEHFDYRHSTHMKLFLIRNLVADHKFAAALGLTVNDANEILALVGNVTDYQRELRRSGLTAVEQTKRHSEFTESQLLRVEEIAIVPNRELFDDLARRVFLNRIGPVAAAMNNLIKDIELSTLDKKKIKENANHARARLRERSSRLEQELFEMQIDVLDEESKAMIKKFLGPELKDSTPNLTVYLYSLRRL